MSRIVKFKNNSGVTNTWCGKLLDIDEIYEPDTDLSLWQRDQDVMYSVGNSDLIVSDGDNWFTNTVDAWNWVIGSKQKISIVEDKPFSDAQGFRARFKGYTDTATAGETTNIDILITEERFINGLQLILKDQAFGDSVDLQVVDINGTYAGILYPVGYPTPLVLDTFGESWYVHSDSQNQDQIIVPYPARLLPGLYVRVIYHSVGETDVQVCANLFLHKKE